MARFQREAEVLAALNHAVSTDGAQSGLDLVMNLPQLRGPADRKD